MNPILKSLLVFVLLAAAGFAADTPMVAEWRKKAEAGDAKFQVLMGACYADDASSDGVPKDDAEAVKWIRKAADQGDAEAQFNLGNMYYSGTGVPKDLVQAHVWWNIAGAKGLEDAKKNLRIVEKEMTDSQKEKAMDLARELFAKLPKR